MLSKLKPSEIHVIRDFMERILANEFEIGSTNYEFGEVYLGFKEHELHDALANNVDTSIDEDYDGLVIKVNGIEINVHKEENGLVTNSVIDDYGKNVELQELQIDLAATLHINNFLYNKLKQRNGTFILRSFIVHDNTRYEFGKFIHRKDYASQVEWRSYAKNDMDNVPVYGKTTVHLTGDGRRRYISVNGFDIYLDQLIVVKDNAE